MIIIEFPQVLIDNELHLGIHVMIDLESQKYIKNEFIDSIMYRKVVSHMLEVLLLD